jgi:hypothetical protein
VNSFTNSRSLKQNSATTAEGVGETAKVESITLSGWFRSLRFPSAFCEWLRISPQVSAAKTKSSG